MLKVVDKTEVHKRESIKKVKIKGCVPNNFKWLVNKTKAEKDTKDFKWEVYKKG